MRACGADVRSDAARGGGSGALLLKGCTRSEIARELFVSGDTVKTHIRNLYRKTGVTGKDELVQAIGGKGLV